MARNGVTVRGIAALAGVSAATVSRTLRNPESVSDRARQRVRVALQQIDGQAAAEDRVSLPTIGCLFVNSTSGPRFAGFDATIWSGLARVAVAHGTDLLLLNVDRRHANESLRQMARRRGIGGLAVRLDTGSADLVDELADADVPALVIAHKHDNPKVGFVCVNSRETSREAVDHLIHLGHRRIAFCRNFVPDRDHTERLLGYRDALTRRGLEPDADLEIAIPADPDGGATAINRLLALPAPPTAAYFADPLPTFGALKRLGEVGLRVPRDFSVVGFDDDSTRKLACPVYTAVCQDAPALAAMAGQLLCRMMLGSGPPTPPRVELSSYLEVNTTTGPAPAPHIAGGDA